jgi:hypothetical protein
MSVCQVTLKETALLHKPMLIRTNGPQAAPRRVLVYLKDYFPEAPKGITQWLHTDLGPCG